MQIIFGRWLVAEADDKGLLNLDWPGSMSTLASFASHALARPCSSAKPDASATGVTSTSPLVEVCAGFQKALEPVQT